MNRKLTKDQAEKKPVNETKDKVLSSVALSSGVLSSDSVQLEAAKKEANRNQRLKVGMEFNYKAAFETVIAHYYEVATELDIVTENNEDVRDVMTKHLEIIEKELKDCIEMKAFHS